MDTLKRVAVASERPVHPRVGEGFAGDKFRVSGTKEMEEGAGANNLYSRQLPNELNINC